MLADRLVHIGVADALLKSISMMKQVQFGPDEEMKQRLINELEGTARSSWTTARDGY